jgi:sugar phosphate isomerase/epimerase
MTSDELIDYASRQITSAEKLGFPVLRIQTFAKPDILEKLIPIAEKAKVHLASELHSPLTIENPQVVELLEFYKKIQSPVLGFIPDFSSTMKAVPELFWNHLIRLGAPLELINFTKELWNLNEDPKEKFEKLHEKCKELNASPSVSGQINMVLTMFGHMNVEGWKEILPFVKHIHGKFYQVNSGGIEPSIPYQEIFSLLKEEKYSGTISAEWEGQAFTEEPIGFEQVLAWRSMCNNLIA